MSSRLPLRLSSMTRSNAARVLLSACQSSLPRNLPPAPHILTLPSRAGTATSTSPALRASFRNYYFSTRAPCDVITKNTTRQLFSFNRPHRFGTRYVSLGPFKHPAPRQLPRSYDTRQRFVSGDVTLPPGTQSFRQTIIRSGFGLWTTVVAISIITSAVVCSVDYSDLSRTKQGLQPHQVRSHDTKRVTIEHSYTTMTGEALPGRPGTLTSEEEEKLREFWIATLKVFGVLDPKENGHASESSVGNDTTRPDTASSKTPKKKRMSLFRKKEKESSDSTDSSHHSTSTADSEDKYGQNKEFQEALAMQSPESLRTAFWGMVKHNHPDALLLRFLRARKWDVERALVMMISTLRWRATEMHIDDDIMKNGELGSVLDANSSDPAKKKLGEDFLAQLRLGKSFLHGLDKDERPMCFVRVRLHRQGEQSEESLERYTVFVIESARMILVAPHVDTAAIVFDMTGFSMANMDYTPLKFMIKCFEANYPESLGLVLVHKAPWIFQGIWKIIKGWLDPVVASKVQFTNSRSEMEAFVPKSQIITELEGEEDWEYKYVEPKEDENDLMKDTATRDRLLKNREGIVQEYEKAILDWIHGNGETEKVKEKRNELADTLRDDYWNLDPYIRARSYYDRVGMINPGGKVQFYGSEKAEPKASDAATTNGTAKLPETNADDID